jgi:hypothetical protein
MSQDKNILHFTLPSGVFALAPRSLSCLVTVPGGKPVMLAQEMVTSRERRVILPLFKHFPFPCPYEAMHASYYQGNLCKKTIAQSRGCLREARKAGTWELIVKPIRCMLWIVRQKLRTFDLTVSTIIEQGYLLHYETTNNH